MDKPDIHHLFQHEHHQFVMWLVMKSLNKVTSHIMKWGTEKNTISLLHLLAKSEIKLKDFLQIDAHYLYCFKWLRKCFWLKKAKGMCKFNARNDLELCLEGTIRTMGEINKVCSSSNSIESMVFSCLGSIQWLQREHSCF